VSTVGAIDCDIHTVVPRTEDLVPCLGEYWREMRVLRELDRMDSAGHPASVLLPGRPDWRPQSGARGTSLEMLREQALSFYDENMAAAFCRVVNERMVTVGDEYVLVDHSIAAVKTATQGQKKNLPTLRREK
jgi:uncharacterized protein